MRTAVREITLPVQLCELAEQRFASRFNNIEELLTFVLRELVERDASDMDRADQQVIESRLKDLGYL